MGRKRKKITSARKRLPRKRYAIFFFVVAAFAAIVRLLIRDRFPLLSTFYYATPWAIIAFLLFISGFLWLRVGRRKLGLGLLLFAILPAGWHARLNVRSGPTNASSRIAMFRVLSWNAARGGWSPTRLRREIVSSGADIVGIVETGAGCLGQIDFWEQTFRDRNLSRFASGMLLASRFAILTDDTIDIGENGRCRHFLVATPGRPVHILLVDILSNPFISRREPLLALASVVRRYGGTPLILMGDFNTPGDSVWFDPLRGELQDAFDLAGHGYRPTWPVPLPVLDLDHVWINRQVDAHCVESGWSIASDHRAITADLAIRP